MIIKELKVSDLQAHDRPAQFSKHLTLYLVIIRSSPTGGNFS